MNRITALLTTLVLTFTCFVSASEEAGKYDRSSVSYIDALWLLDGSTRKMSNAQVGKILDATKKEIMMKRFDYNPLPSYIKSRFVAEANRSLANFSGSDEAALDAVTKVMNQTVVPEVIKILDATKEIRAQKMLTEEQKNSFITDKAKELGITAAELEKVMNSAYIFIPLAKNYKQSTKGDSYIESINLGIIWWKISTDGGKAKATVATRDFTKTMGNSTVGASYGTGNHKDFAFNSMVKNGARNLKVATQEIPEFKLSGQVLTGNGMKATFDLGKEEGIRVDDKYYIMKNTMDGKQKKAGWMIVKKVGDSSGSMGYQSNGQVISGKPMIGSAVQEFPRLPIDISIKGRKFAYNVEDSDNFGYIRNLKLDNGGFGFGANASYNFGRLFGVSQLFFDFGFGMGFGEADGESWGYTTGSASYTEISSVKNTSFDFSLIKKFYFRRMAFLAQAGFGIQNVSIDAGDWLKTYYFQYTNSGMGGFATAGLEFAVSPRIAIGGNIGYTFMGESDEWEYEMKEGIDGEWKSYGTMSDDEKINHSGLTWGAYITYSPRALPFDPLAMIAGKMKKK